jgi:phosphopantetheinyl transferase
VKLGDSERVQKLFTASSREVTPASAAGLACVLYAPPARDPQVTRQCGTILTAGELERAGRFTSEQDRARFIQRRAFRRFCGARALGSSTPLSQVEFSETENGQPYIADLPGFHFSFSACPLGFLGAWSSSHSVGVDFEDCARVIEAVKVARWYFSGAEASAVEDGDDLQSRRAFFQLWTLKEAALKSVGEGLPFGLDAFQFRLAAEPVVVHAPLARGGAEKFNAHFIGEVEGCAALVIHDQVGTIRL